MPGGGSSLLGRTSRTAVVAGLLLCAACDATIASGLDEGQANDIMVALDARGIGAAKEREGGASDEPSFEVRVPPADVGRALAVLRAAELPRRPEAGFDEVFGEASLVPTATEERARYVAALGGELARSIETIDGVLDARVHVALPDQRDFVLDDERPAPRASVLVKYAPGDPPYDERSVRALVAGAVHGLSLDDVAVIGVPGPAPRGGTAALVRVGPVAVSQGSATTLKAVLGGSLGLHVLMAGLLVFVMLRRRRGEPSGAGEAVPGEA